jgi:hypothetical protein
VITELKPNEYIVVGTNYDGNHAGGAALYAHEHFGLQTGCGEGLSGQTYALPTMCPLDDIASAAYDFIEFARYNPDKAFLMTRIGCGIAGYTDEQIAPLFRFVPSNVVLPEEWAGMVNNANTGAPK